MVKHVHAELMMQFAQDAAETSVPLSRWQFDSGKGWEDFPYTSDDAPTWTPQFKYRRKPKTMNINGYEVPEPLREAPEYGKKVYTPHISSDKLVIDRNWDGEAYDVRNLERGIVHLTKEAAETHARALLSFTETKK